MLYLLSHLYPSINVFTTNIYLSNLSIYQSIRLSVHLPIYRSVYLRIRNIHDYTLNINITLECVCTFSLSVFPPFINFFKHRTFAKNPALFISFSFRYLFFSSSIIKVEFPIICHNLHFPNCHLFTSFSLYFFVITSFPACLFFSFFFVSHCLPFLPF